MATRKPSGTSYAGLCGLGVSVYCICVARTKKARMSAPPSDDEDEETQEASAALSQRISRFKKSPVKQSGRGRSAHSCLTPPPFTCAYGLHGGISGRSRASDDDDFIVPDSDSPAQSRTSSRDARSSGRSSSPDLSDEGEAEEDEGEERPKKVKAAKKGKGAPRRPPFRGGGGGGGGASQSAGGGSNAFLTAAERRAQEQKSEKKAGDDPFEFLIDIKDVGPDVSFLSEGCAYLSTISQKDGVRPGEPGYDKRTLYIPSKAWKNFTPFEKQVSLNS